MLLFLYFLILVNSLTLDNQFILSLKDSHKVPTEYATSDEFFKQASYITDDKYFDIKKDFGLNPEYTWDLLTEKLHIYNNNSVGSKYKVLFLQRHGEGYHNIAPSMYNKKDWECFWQIREGNGVIEWYDAQLTSTGMQQIDGISSTWKAQIANNKAPIPQSFYVSPLRRALQTHQMVWRDISSSKAKVKENYRETYGIGTESKRHSKPYIQEHFSFAEFDEDFTEFDEFWNATHHESYEHRRMRARLLLDDIFINDSNLFISITSHSGLISSLLQLIGHRKWSLGTGQMIPVFVIASSFGNYHQPPLTEPWKQLNCDKN